MLRVGVTKPLGVELGGGPVRVDHPAALALLLAGHVAALLVAQLDAGPAGQSFDRLDEAEPVDLLHELDDVAALGATEAVPGENVVLERKSMTFVDCGAEDFFHPVRLKYLADNPGLSFISLTGTAEPQAMLVEEEEFLGEVRIDEDDPEQ